jgi:hypothetical protein
MVNIAEGDALQTLMRLWDTVQVLQYFKPHCVQAAYRQRPRCHAASCRKNTCLEAISLSFSLRLPKKGMV